MFRSASRLESRLHGIDDDLHEPMLWNRAPRARPEVESARRDISRGRLTHDDLIHRVDHYKSILVDTLANDPLARERIRRLVGRIRGLEDLVKRLRAKRRAR
jgi:hypothetical protein